MSEILQLLQNSIIALGILGLLSACAAIRSVWQQLKQFKDLTQKSNSLKIDITDGKSPAEHAKNIRQWMAVSTPSQQQSHAGKKKAAKQPNEGKKAKRRKLRTWWYGWYAPQNLLHLRLEPMLNVVEDQEGHRRLPYIDDLHEWSQEREFSRPCVSLHGLVVGSLLIMGILGTLVGVHASLEAPVNGDVSRKILQRLLPALNPSMCAVGFTIFLTIAKGIYLQAVEQYLSQLDRYTLDTLIPALQPADYYEDMDERMSGSLQKINDVFSLFNEIADGICETCGAVKTYAEGLIDAAHELPTVAKGLANAGEDAESARLTLAEAIDRMKQLCQKLTSCFQEMDTDAKELRDLGEKACARIKEQGDTYAKTGSAMEAETAALIAGLKGLIAKAPSLDGLEKTVNSLSLQAATLSALHTSAEHMTQEVNDLRDRVITITNHTNDTCQHLQGILLTESKVTNLLQETSASSRSLTNKQSSYLEHVAAGLLHPLADRMQQNENTQRNYVKDIAEHSKKYHKPFISILHPLEWVALIVIIVIILNH